MSYASGFFSDAVIGGSGRKARDPGIVTLAGIQWNVFTDATANAINNIASDGQTVIAVSSLGNIYRAPHGTKEFAGPFATPQAVGLNTITAKPFNAVASGGAVGGIQPYGIRSINGGVSWDQESLVVMGNVTAFGAGFNEKTGMLMIAGDSDKFATSFDGANWANASQAVFGSTTPYSLFWFDSGTPKGRWIFAPGTPGLSANVATSDDDGVTWVQRGPTNGNQAKYRFAYNKFGKLAMAAALGACHISPDNGATWVTTGIGGSDFVGVEALPTGRFIFAGVNRGDGKPRIEICDSDGSNIRVIDAPINCTINVVQYFGNRLYFVGVAAGNPVILSTTSQFF